MRFLEFRDIGGDAFFKDKPEIDGKYSRDEISEAIMGFEV